MHEKLKEVCKQIGVKDAGQKVAGQGKVAWRKNATKPFFFAENKQVQVFGRRSALRESLLSLWQVDINLALWVCEDRQTQVDASETSYVFFKDWMIRGQGKRVSEGFLVQRPFLSGFNSRRLSLPLVLVELQQGCFHLSLVGIIRASLSCLVSTWDRTRSPQKMQHTIRCSRAKKSHSKQGVLTRGAKTSTARESGSQSRGDTRDEDRKFPRI